MSKMPPAKKIQLAPQVHDSGKPEAPISLVVHEAGDGFPVVLSHGFPELAFSWRHQLPALCDAGYRAIETLRLEKGYRAWSSDIGPDHTPDEAGLGWAVKMKSNMDFMGRAAVQAQRENGVKKMLATFTTAPDVILSGRETIYRNGERCGWLSSGGYGHTLGKSIGLGYVRNPGGVTKDYVLSGDYELEVATKRVKAEVTLSPLYDPGMQKIKT